MAESDVSTDKQQSDLLEKMFPLTELSDKDSNELEKAALDYIESIFSTPESLENLPLVMAKEMKTRNNLQSKMRSDTKTKMGNLKRIIDDVRLSCAEAKKIQSDMKEVRSLCEEFEKVYPDLEKIISSSRSAIAASDAVNLLNQLLNMSQTLKNTRELIKNMDLLHAHKNIRDLESLRDKVFSNYLTSKSHSIDPSKDLESWPPARNFSEIDEVDKSLRSKLLEILENIPTYCKRDPTSMVSCIRVIEREDMLDKYWKETKRSPSSHFVYIPTQRPKNLSSLVQRSIEKTAKNKLEELRKQVNFNDKTATTEWLEKIRGHVLDVLLTIQRHGVQCFPSAYDILNKFCYTYQSCISALVEDMVVNWGEMPKENDMVAVLMFDRDYAGEQLFGCPQLNKSVMDIVLFDKPLLRDDIRERLQQNYSSVLFQNLNAKVKRAINLEMEDLKKDTPPSMKDENLYITQLPKFYDELVGIQLRSANSLPLDIHWEVFKNCVAALELLVRSYTDALDTYVKANNPIMHVQTTTNKAGAALTSILNLDKNIEASRPQHTQSPYYVQYCIAVANNTTDLEKHIRRSCKQVANDLKRRRTEAGSYMGEDEDEILGEYIVNRISGIISMLEELATMCTEAISLDLIKDIEGAFAELFTKKWRDHYEDWCTGFRDSVSAFAETVQSLCTKYRNAVFGMVDLFIARAYLTAFITQTGRYTPEELKTYGDIVYGDGVYLSLLFSDLLNVPAEDVWTRAICMCADVFRTTDASSTSIDLFNLIKVYSDFGANHASALLRIRGDVKKQDIQTTVSSLMENQPTDKKRRHGVFSFIRV